MEEKIIPKNLQNLIFQVSKLPDEHRKELGPFLDATVEDTMRRRRILMLIQESLSTLRVDMKYLVFDLEATRRERDDATIGETTKQDFRRFKTEFIDSIMEGLDGVEGRERILETITNSINKKARNETL